MSKDSNNPINTDLFESLQKEDSEVQTHSSEQNKPSVAFIKKCIHPPSSINGFAGLPTNDSRSQVCIEWRSVNINKRPILYNPDADSTQLWPLDAAVFDVCYLHTNGARVLSIPFFSNPFYSNNRMTQDLANVITNNMYNWNNWEDDANKFRVIYKSTTQTLNATAFNNTGIVTGNQFNPAILFQGFLNSSRPKTIALLCPMWTLRSN
nr:hypothetical protein [Hepelivirales sp.]